MSVNVCLKMVNSNQDDSALNQQAVEFGTRLKYIREYNGLSQRELAKRAGVPHSSISMIEQGQNSPSINSLARILGGIPMSIAHFFSCDLSLLNEQIFRAADLRTKQRTVFPLVTAQSIPLHNPLTQTRFERLAYAINSDTGQSPQYSTHALSGYVVSGCIELTLNAEVVNLTSGDAFSLGTMQPYRLRNLSSTDECIIITCNT
ncbi:MAG: helix-turn-helix domain-containing protein [Moraxellaceae bacterium]|nr:MAG: helix-turn-helix domain-containing protein [Moraxellaceae bacterium]